MKRNPLLFLDTSIIIAAVLSPGGGSHGLIDLARHQKLRIVITETVIIEAYGSLKQKYGKEEIQVLRTFLTELRKWIKKSPNPKELAKYDKIMVDPDDRHILAGTEKYKADYLITLDRKHFFTEDLELAKLKFMIHTPQMFLKEFRHFYD